MANVRAVKSGNWSDTTVWNTGALPTTADDVYSNTFTVTIDQDITVLTLRTTSNTGITAGGGFVLNSGYTATATATVGIIPGTTTCITYSGSGASTLNANVGISQNGGVSILMSGTGTLNIVGNLRSDYLTTGGSLRLLIHNSAGTTNIIGDFVGSYTHDSTAMLLSGTGTINQTGNMYIGGTGANNGTALSITNGTYNLTGNITAGNRPDTTTLNFINVLSPGRMLVTGNVTKTTPGGAGISSNNYLNIIGTISFTSAQAISSTGICLMSGPFICGTYGGFPYSVTRMHLIPVLNNYFEFRDNSTNGALSPGAIASASRMVSADTIIDAPSVSNVRFGVSYGNGAFTGTCRIPSPSNVSLNVPFDTGSTGTAFLSATDIAQMGTNIWNIPTANLTGSNTIGERMANSSTVDTMGNQLASLL